MSAASRNCPFQARRHSCRKRPLPPKRSPEESSQTGAPHRLSAGPTPHEVASVGRGGGQRALEATPGPARGQRTLALEKPPCSLLILERSLDHSPKRSSNASA